MIWAKALFKDSIFSSGLKPGAIYELPCTSGGITEFKNTRALALIIFLTFY